MGAHVERDAAAFADEACSPPRADAAYRGLPCGRRAAALDREIDPLAASELPSGLSPHRARPDRRPRRRRTPLRARAARARCRARSPVRPWRHRAGSRSIRPAPDEHCEGVVSREIHPAQCAICGAGTARNRRALFERELVGQGNECARRHLQVVRVATVPSGAVHRDVRCGRAATSPPTVRHTPHPA